VSGPTYTQSCGPSAEPSNSSIERNGKSEPWVDFAENTASESNYTASSVTLSSVYGRAIPVPDETHFDRNDDMDCTQEYD
jgi:hypothetical protein